ncbi:MAG: hypothetical protein ABIK98_08870 [Pseudomonadota bacterium]
MTSRYGITIRRKVYEEPVELAAIDVKQSAIRCLDAHAHLGIWFFKDAAGLESISMRKTKIHF